MTITLKICADEKEWDRLVDRSPHATIFHTWKFLKIVEKYSSSKFYALIGSDGSEPVGLYPIFFQRKLFLRMVFSPPPHCAVPYLGPLIVAYDELKQSKRESKFLEFQREVDGFISSKLKANYVSISTPPGLLDARPLKWSGYSVEPMYNYRIDLTLGLDHIWGQLKKKFRQNINKEKNKEIVIEEGGREDVVRIYDLLIERYGEQDRKVSESREYIMELFDAFHPANMKVYIVKHQGRNIGGVIDLYYKEKASSWVGNTKPKVSEIDATDALQWEAISRAHKSGCKYYEEIGANTERLCRYKSKFNPEVSIYFRATKYTRLSRFFEAAYKGVFKPFFGR